VVVGLLAGALGLEALARLSWEDDWQDPTHTGVPAGEGDLPVLNGVMELARRNTRGIHRNVYHRTNSRGIRGPEYDAQPPEGVFRIAVTGDSTTMGAGVLEEERYTNQLEARLGEGYEVLNTGVSGLNIGAGVRRLARVSRHYESDLFVYGFSTNDIEGPSYRTPADVLPPADFAHFYWSMIAAAERSPSYFHRYLILWRLGMTETGKGDQVVLENFLDNPAAWRDFVAGLDRFAALASKHGVCGHVLIHPQLARLDEEHPYLEVYDRVGRAALERGLSVTQSFPYFVEHAPRRERALWVSLFDPHPNRRGHALLAEALHEGLKQLPPECWKKRP
jgi:lysophospholipase L1-like esterase